jgi:hypothetical protein
MNVQDSPDRQGLEAAEDRLQVVVAANDAAGLAMLLHDDLLATGPDGSLSTKDDDVAGYADGSFRVTSYRQMRRKVILVRGTGVTAVRANISGRASDRQFDVVMDYTRTWVHEGGRWQILAAHLSTVQES